MRPLYCRFFHRHTSTLASAHEKPPSNSGGPALAEPPEPVPDLPFPATDPNLRGSRRILRAAILIGRGGNLEQIAEMTDVPVALLELIREEQHRNTRSHPFRGRRSPQARLLVVVVLIIEFAAAANILASVTALIHHSTALAILTGIVAIALTFAVWGLARLLTPEHRTIASHSPPNWFNRRPNG